MPSIKTYCFLHVVKFCCNMFLLMYREPSSGWQCCKEKLLRKSPLYYFTFCRYIVEFWTSWISWFKTKCDHYVWCSIVSTCVKNGVKTTVVKSCILVLPGGSVDLCQRCLALGVALFYFLWHVFWIGGIFLMSSVLWLKWQRKNRNDDVRNIPPIQNTCQGR